MNAAIITTILRSVLSIVAGGLIANGTLEDADIQTITGVLVGLGTAVWSIYQKIATKKALAKATASSSTTPPAVPK